MTERRMGAPWQVPALVELSAWFGPAVAFLYVYIVRLGHPYQAALPHLLLVAALWLGTCGARALLPPGPKDSRAYLASAAVLLPWLLLLTWYAVALLGLHAWGRLTTWPIFTAYAGQATQLLSALGFPAWMLLAPPASVIALVSLVGRFNLLRAPWPRHVFGASPARQRRLLGALLLSVPLVLGTMITTMAAASRFEPVQISMTKAGASLRQNHDMFSSPATNHAEQDAIQRYAASSRHQGRNLILIVGDALRSDHMGVYGYSRDTTPFLSALARRAGTDVIPRVRATCAESLCGLMSLAASRPLHDMPQAPFTLQQVLKRNGYQIHMVLSGDHTNFYGLREFYGAVDSYWDGSTQRVMWGQENEHRYVNDDQLVLDRIDALPVADARQPVMIQIALMSSHGLAPRRHAPFQPSQNYYSWFRRSTGTGRIKESDRQSAVNFYDNGVRQLDGFTDAIISRLRDKGYLDEALVVVTGDHGELLGEHGYFAHAVTVYEPALSIPLILSRFGYESPPLHARPIAAQIDIAPTIVRELDLPAPSTWRGHALQDRPVAESGRKIYFQQATEAGLYEVQPGGKLLKYWRNFTTGNEFAFDPVHDPGEQTNLFGSIPKSKRDHWRLAVAHGGLQRESSNIPNNHVIVIEED